MAGKTPRKPEARVVSEVCSMCGLDWARHGATPTTETCIRLLASDLAAANARANYTPPTLIPYPVYPRPYPRPMWWGTMSPPYVSVGTSGYTPNYSAQTPRAISAVSSAR